MVAPAVPEHPLEGPVIDGQHPLKKALRHGIEAAVALLPGRPQEAAAQHGGEGQGDEAGHQDGRHDGHRKFVEQPAQDAAHEKHRDEDRGQRQGHGEDGEADLPGARQGRLEGRLPHLHVPHDIFQHHDGVVHHEAHRQDQGHQGEVVQAVAQEIHDRRRCPRWTWAGPDWG